MAVDLECEMQKRTTNWCQMTPIRNNTHCEWMDVTMCSPLLPSPCTFAATARRKSIFSRADYCASLLGRGLQRLRCLPGRLLQHQPWRHLARASMPGWTDPTPTQHPSIPIDQEQNTTENKKNKKREIKKKNVCRIGNGISPIAPRDRCGIQKTKQFCKTNTRTG